MISPGAWKDFVIRAVLHKDPVLAWGAGEAEAQPSSMGIEEPHSKKCLKSYLLFWGGNILPLDDWLVVHVEQ